jgi:flagellar assembly protein FliH
VEWTDGGAERDQARLIQEIEAAVDRALDQPAE